MVINRPLASIFCIEVDRSLLLELIRYWCSTELVLSFLVSDTCIDPVWSRVNRLERVVN
jgi:hypothetical protein